MEEKDYKKLYEDVVALAKDGLKDGLYLSQSAKAVTEYLFPQLKETEDERIRKELIERFKWELKGAEEQDAAGCSRQKDIAMFKRGIAWLEKQDIKLQEYIDEERNKKDFYCEGKEMSWNEIPLDVRKHDYPYYFKDGLDCFPFNAEKQGEQKPSWNEEDEKMLTSTIEYLNEFGEVYQKGAQECIAWLKSLKDRVHSKQDLFFNF